jgi:hypothetical protein
LMRCLVGGYGFLAICHMSVGCSVWGARLCRHAGALTSIVCSCVAVCCSHWELDVLVEAVGKRHLGWNVADESYDHVKPNSLQTV